MKHIKGNSGTSSIETPVVIVLLIILMVGVYEVANYILMSGQVKNNVTTLTETMAQVNVPSSQSFGGLEAGIKKAFDEALSKTVEYLQEYGTGDEKQFHMVSSLSTLTRPNFVVSQRGTLAVSGAKAYGFLNPNECDEILQKKALVNNYLGVVHGQLCVNFRDRIGSFFGAFSMGTLGQICRTACMPLLTSLRPNDGGSGFPNTGDGGGDGDGGGGGAGKGCRHLNKVDYAGVFLPQMCGSDICKQMPGVDVDDMYMQLNGYVGARTCGITKEVESCTCAGGCTMVKCLGCDCAQGSTNNGICEMDPATCISDKNFWIEVSRNVCNTRMYDKGYKRAQERTAIPGLTFKYSQNKVVGTYTTIYECGTPEYPKCCEEPHTCTECQVFDGGWTPPNCTGQKSTDPKYDDCCEKECSLEGKGSGACTTCHGKEGNNHCQNHFVPDPPEICKGL